MAATVGKRQDYIERRLSLLGLVVEAQELVNSGNLESSYAFALAEYGLDANRQRLALRALRECPSPSLGWWRGVLAELQTQQANDGAGSLFDLAIFDAAERVADVLPVAAYREPGLPGRDVPPVRASGPRAILLEQARYWKEQAAAWERLGKPGNRDKCEGASIALESAALALPDDPPMRAAGETGKRARRGWQKLDVRPRTVPMFAAAAGLAD